MSEEQRQQAALANDPVTAARIVRKIAEIERDFHLANGALSERVMREAVLIITRAISAPLQVVEVDWTARIIAPEWRQTRGVGNGDAWLELTDLTGETVEDCTWISTVTGTGDTRLVLELMFRRGLADAAKAVIRDDKALAPLWEKGFTRDEDDARLLIMIKVEAELLAQAFEQNDLDQALAPIGKAVELAIAAKAELDSLVDQVRDAAKAR